MTTSIINEILDATNFREYLTPKLGRSFNVEKLIDAKKEMDDNEECCGMCGELVEDCRCLKFDPDLC